MHQVFGLSKENILILVSKTIGSKKVSFIESRNTALDCPGLVSLTKIDYTINAAFIHFSSPSVNKATSNPLVSMTTTKNPTLSI